MDPILEAMYADTCPTPPPPQAGAIPEPTPGDFIYDSKAMEQWYQFHMLMLCKSKVHQFGAALIRRLAAAERERDDARRRVEKVERVARRLRKAINCHYVDECQDCRDAVTAFDSEMAKPAAPGTGGTTGGSE
jgi:hypothetical protein